MGVDSGRNSQFLVSAGDGFYFCAWEGRWLQGTGRRWWVRGRGMVFRVGRRARRLLEGELEGEGVSGPVRGTGVGEWDSGGWLGSRLKKAGGRAVFPGGSL